MSKNPEPQRRLARWVFYKHGLILKQQDQVVQDRLKAEYAEARRVVGSQLQTKDQS